MKTINVLFAVVLMAAFACQQTKPQEEKEEPLVETTAPLKLTKIWETDSVFFTPESVIYDEFRDVLYVSNIAGLPPDTLDYDGFVSILSTDGKVINRDWVTGISSIKGMGIVDSSLFVTDLFAVVEIDIPSGQIVNTFPIEGSVFLNDITVSPNKEVFISDSRDDKIYTLVNGEISVWMDTPGFGGPNGVLHTGDRLITAAFGAGNIHEFDLATKTSKILADSLFQGDGINEVGDDLLISCWRGVVYHLKADGTKTIVLDTQAEKKGAADAWYVPSKKTLYIPTFYGNTVAAYLVE